jgi:glyoxylase-like metal-dependent hydrolase (beta-lactamase superfamily II)
LKEAPVDAQHYPFQLSGSQCIALSDGSYDYRLEQMVANVPKSHVEEFLQAHGLPSHMITTPFTSLYVNTGQHKILVDMGAGKLFPSTGRLLESLRLAGIEPDTIDSVFITHAHPDHIGGTLNDSGELVFSKAKYYLNKAEWDFWFSNEAANQAGEWMANFAREKLKPISDRVKLLDREDEIIPTVSVLFTPGHTPGHMVVSFNIDGEQLLYTGDTVLLPLHLEHPDWLPVFDILPEQAAMSKQRIFDLAASTKCHVMGQQFPFPSLGYVIKTASGWKWNLIETTR